MAEKCNNGAEATIAGVPLDPCLYHELVLRNVTIHILTCDRCGHVEISWERQADTEEDDV